MRPFEYRAPASIDEAVTLLADSGERARLLAGGTDLLVQLRLGLFEPDLVIDIKKIPELNCISLDSGEGLTIGAAVSCARLCEHLDALGAYPGLVDAASIVGGTAIQGRATVGGNLCNAAPSGDTIPAMIVLGATCIVAGPHGLRAVPAEMLCTGPGRTILGRGEILISIHLPPPVPNSGARYLRFIPRGEMDIAVVGAGAWVVLSDDHAQIVSARVALAAVAPTPLLASSAGDSLIGKSPDEDALAQAAQLAREATQPITDLRGTEAQRRHLVGVLVMRALRGAVRRAKGDPVELNAGGPTND